MVDGRHARILVVDDEDSSRELLVEWLGNEGYRVDTSVDGLDAWERLEAEPGTWDVVILDRVMPRLSGIDLLRRIKRDRRFAVIPVIIQTAMRERDAFIEGIRAGAYYYLVKPFEVEVMLSIVRTAVSDYAQYKTLQREVARGISCLNLLQSASFQCRTIDEAIDLGTVIANACPDPEKTVVGLTELLINAVEHGNLGITYREKSRLVDRKDWDKEIQRRLSLPENVDKRISIHFERRQQKIRIRIEDEGKGFDWKPYLEVDPLRALDTHGRGIAMANHFSFTRVEYEGRGNVVIGTIDL